jgi:ABC-type branched-subunit amino acid transport system substrate-binding protein
LFRNDIINKYSRLGFDLIYRFLIVFIFALSFFAIFDFRKPYNQESILLGTSLPKDGIIQEWGKSVLTGANSYFKYANENNILDDKKVHLLSYDDKYEPDLTYLNTKRLILEDNVFALFGFVGTPTVKKILPLIENTKIPFVAPFTGAGFLRTNNHSNIINIRSSYQEEIYKIVKYLNNQKGITNFAVFYQNDDYGEEVYSSLLKVLRVNQLKLVSEGSYKRNTLSISHALHAMKNKDIGAIIMIGAYKANALFIKKAREIDNLKDTIFATVSFGDANAMIKELNYESKNLIFSQVVPSYDDTTLEIAKEYRKIYSHYYPKNDFSFISFESFIAAKAVIKSLEKTKDNLTRVNFIDSLKSLNKNDIKDLDLEFRNHQLLNKAYLYKYEDSKFKEIKYELK